YTGENVAELHIHGGLAVIRTVLRAVEEAGAHPAEPGEFTRRAFLNGRLDLIQAESIASLVGAAGEAAQHEALKQRSGELSEKVNSVRTDLRDILGQLEVDFDYPEERPDGIRSTEAIERIGLLVSGIDSMLATFTKGQLLDGFRLAIIGRPNVGKSSLLNILLREERAIVTSSPGTTRDVVSGSLEFGGVPAEILDTAGIRAMHEKSDTAEAEGIRRSWREVERAHIVLMVFDLSEPLNDEDAALVSEARTRTKKTAASLLVVCNKIDLPSACPHEVVGPLINASDLPSVAVSAKTGENIENLRDKVCELLDLNGDMNEIILTELRHRALLEETRKILDETLTGLKNELPQDVAATELWGADRALGRILGEGLGAADLDEIFSRFCIGK
ncbi:MAG: tRNA uridine-5-carboxymethylaminomethyl(34) synthesis GTPase MnmE, partial [bacterium]